MVRWAPVVARASERAIAKRPALPRQPSDLGTKQQSQWQQLQAQESELHAAREKIEMLLNGKQREDSSANESDRWFNSKR